MGRGVAPGTAICAPCTILVTVQEAIHTHVQHSRAYEPEQARSKEPFLLMQSQVCMPAPMRQSAVAMALTNQRCPPCKQAL